MTRSLCPTALGLLLGLIVAQTAWGDDDITLDVGVRKIGNRCIAFNDPSPTKPLNRGETLHFRIKNKCTDPWNIRIDRDPNEHFAKDCAAVSTPAFVFETDNLVPSGDTWEVDCRVRANHIHDTYVFTVTGSAPHPAGKAKPIISTLAVEVDP